MVAAVGSSTNKGFPIELMEMFRRMDENINDVKERVIRIEAQEHGAAQVRIKEDLEKEREHRIALQMKVIEIQTKLIPITGIGSALVGGLIGAFIRLAA